VLDWFIVIGSVSECRIIIVWVTVVGGCWGSVDSLVSCGMKFVVRLAEATTSKYLVLLSPFFSQFVPERYFHFAYRIHVKL
jgi:hypothetical protein